MTLRRVKTQFERNFGFVRVATATPKLKVGNPDFNSDEIVRLLVQAEKDSAAIVFFPELSITGYTCGDLFHNFELLEGALAGLDKIREASEKSFSGIAFVGLPLMVDDVVFNCAAAVSRGKVLGFVPKSLLPNSGEFYEWRWFSPAESAISNTVTLGDEVLPFGTDLLFTADDFSGLIIALDVCEDGWAADPPSTTHALMGATIIGNLSASPEWVSKSEYRRMLFTMRSATLISAYAYTSSGVHESTSDLVFSGHQLICENGSLLAQCPAFSRESKLTLADVDLERLLADRIRIKNFADSRRRLETKPKYRHITFSTGTREAPQKLMRMVDARPFVPRDSAQLSERCDDIFNIQVAGLAKRLEQLGKNPSIVIGVSGGLDSTLALLVACRTMDLLKLPRTNIRGFTMPGFGTTQRTKNNAVALMKELGITQEAVADIRATCLQQMKDMNHKPFGRIDIDAIYTEATKQAGSGKVSFIALQNKALEVFDTALSELPPDSQDLVFENVQARTRTNILMNSGFVLGTGDLSELALGWCTYNGDHMSMYSVNSGVPKSLVKFLVKWVAENVFSGEARRILIDIFETEISPELLPAGKDGTIAQKTESLIGPYELHDFFLYNMLRFGFRPEKILYLAKQAKFSEDYRETEIRKWLKTFIQRFFRNQFKRNCLPDGPKVGSICLSPRGDWRMPSDADETIWLKWADKPEKTDTNGGDWERTKTSKAEWLKEQKQSAVSTTGKGNDQVGERNNVLRVLLRVDEQLDFMPGGALAVDKGDEVVPVSNALAQSGYYDLVIDSMDEHPPDHGSFASQHEGKIPFIDRIILNGVEQVLWPDHCVRGTKGCEFHPDLDRSMVARTIKKGQDPRVDSYSALYENGRDASEEAKMEFGFLGQSTGLTKYLIRCATEAGASEIQVDVVGLAMPYCVSYSARDARQEEYNGKPFRVRVVEDAVGAIAKDKAEFQKDIEDLKALGIEIIQSKDVLSKVATSKK